MRILAIFQSFEIYTKKCRKRPIHKGLRHFSYGPPRGIRTPDLQNRNLLRYPAAPWTVIGGNMKAVAAMIDLLFG